MKLYVKDDSFREKLVRVAVNEKRTACRKLRLHKCTTLYIGHTEKSVRASDGTPVFLAAVFMRRKRNGRKGFVPIEMMLCRTDREAAETALLTHCFIARVETGDLVPGTLCSEDRRTLLTQLDPSAKRRILINAETLSMIVSLPEQESEGTDEEEDCGDQGVSAVVPKRGPVPVLAAAECGV